MRVKNEVDTVSSLRLCPVRKRSTNIMSLPQGECSVSGEAPPKPSQAAISGNTHGGVEAETGKKRKPIPGVLMNRFLLWVTGAQFQGGCLRASAETVSVLPPLRVRI